MSAQVPQGWAALELKDVAKWGSGGTPKSGKSEYYGGDIPWAVIGDLNDGVVTATATTITQAGVDNSSAKVVPKGTLLVAMYGSIGKLGIAGCSLATNQAIAFARPDENRVLPKYLFFYLLSQRQKLLKSGKGATQQNISQTLLKPWPVPVAPLREQAEIVRILEALFSRLDAAAASIAAVRRKADQFRRSIWRTTFLGGFSLEGIRHKNPWPLVEMNQLNHPERPICYGILMPGPDVPDGIPYVKVRDMRNDAVSVDSLNRTSPEIESKYARARLKAGDVLVSIRGTYGRVAIVPQELDGGNITQDTARIAPIGCTNRYLAAYLRSPDAQAFLHRVARGVAVKGVNIGDLRRLPVPVPSTEIQESVVQRLDKYSSVLSDVDTTIVMASKKLESTRRSLLHAAFTGELTREWRETNNG